VGQGGGGAGAQTSGPHVPQEPHRLAGIALSENQLRVETMDYLIQSRNLKNHIDPDFRVPAYGDSGQRGVTLERNVDPTDYLFFHETIGGTRYLLGYICVKEILSGEDARRKYSNLPCDSFDDDWVFIGCPEKSLRLGNPLQLSRNLVTRLSLGVDYSPLDINEKSELEVLLALRAQRRLTKKDREILLESCKKREGDKKAELPAEVAAHLYFYDSTHDVIPLDEIHKIKEKQIEDLLAKTDGALGTGLKVVDKQKQLRSGDRLDLLLENQQRELIVCEIKAPGQTSDGDITQLMSYMKEIEREYPGRTVRGMLVNDGKVSPKLINAAEWSNVEIRAYGVRIATFSLSEENDD